MITFYIDELTLCLKEVEIAEQYIREMNLYESRPSIAIDLVALTRYAKANNINLTELKESEIAMFQRKDQP